MKAKTVNIEQLRCNQLSKNNLQFDMCSYKDFVKESALKNTPHRHNYYMVFFCTAGKGKKLIDFKLFDIKPGMIFTMFPGQIHAWLEDESLEGYLIFFIDSFFNMRYHNNMLIDFPFFNSAFSMPFVALSPELSTHKEALFECMLNEFKKKDRDHLKVLRSYLNIILIEIKRLFDTQTTHWQKQDKNGYLIVNNFEQLINEYYKTKHKVRDYAELLLLTPNYLNAVCNKIIGRPAGELIRNRIMLEAKRLLLHENMTVAEIGMEVGFDDNSYFCRFFKKYEGTSPEKFRKNYLLERN